MTLDLFESLPEAPSLRVLGEGACVLHGFALGHTDELLAGFDAVTAQAPLRHLVVPGGHHVGGDEQLRVFRLGI